MSTPPHKPTIYDVAERAQVSAATVSYVLRGRRGGKSRISEQTRQRVLQAVEALGYVPDQAASSLRRRRTDRVCLVLPRLGAPYFEALAADLQREADKCGLTTILTIADSAEQEGKVLHQLRRRLADAALIVMPRIATEQALSSLARAGVALVVYDGNVEPHGYDVVRTTDAEACADAVSYLISKGHRRIALLGDSTAELHSSRVERYCQLLSQQGLFDETLILNGIHSRHEAYAAAQSLLRRDNPPTAILATADRLAIAVLWAARDMHVMVPERLAVIGAGNIPEDEIAYPPLTTIGPESLDFGSVVSLLFSRMAGDAPAEGRIYLLPRRLILRGSA